MPYTITHQFVSTIPDGTVVTKVKPSNWNADHAIAGSLGGSEIINVPAGIVSATDVQAAINQLAAAIPLPGPGTDPLFLTQGLSVSTYNPTFTLDPNDSNAARFNIATDSAQNNPNFSNITVAEFFNTATNGQCSYGGGTNAKLTFMACDMRGIYNASGQRTIQNNSVVAYGMGDVSIHGNDYVQFAGGPVAGDEGQGWGLVSNLTQQQFLNTTTINNTYVQSTVNTTTTQVITASKDLQTVSVVDTTGAVNGDWVVIEQQLPTSIPNIEAVQIVSFTANSITGIFRNNHANGVTVTPALRISCVSTFQMGQDRVLVNMSQPSYSVGTVASISGGGFVGAGTNWTTNMVGGYALNIGVISLANDDYIGSPFNAGASRLRSWYQIQLLPDTTHIGIYTTSVAGDGSYRGQGVGAGAYTIRPCARVLKIIAPGGGYTGELICETSTSTWSLGDTVEQVICPYPDVTGFSYRLSVFANGCNARSFMDVRNNGARTFESGINFGPSDRIGIQPTADLIQYGSCLSLFATCNYGVDITYSQLGAIRLHSPANTGAGTTDAGSSIMWDLGGMLIGPNTTNLGLQIFTMTFGSDSGKIFFVKGNTAGNPDPFVVEMNYHGWLHLANSDSNNLRPGYIIIDTIVDQTNYERAFFRWTDSDGLQNRVFEIGTEKGAAGTARDMIIKTGGVEQLRFVAGTNIKFTAAANFSANGAVATVLGSIGPAGSHTTVQKWLTIVDDTGATLYIPAF